MENLGWKMLSRISNLVENLGRKMLSRIFLIWGGGKFGVENAISNLEFGGWKIWGGKCYLESPIWEGGGKFGAENAISNLQFFGVENSNLEFGVENLCYLESRKISRNLGGGKFRVENAISNLQFGWVEDLGWKMLARISNLGGGKFGEENAISKFLYFGGKMVENSNLEFGWWKIWGISNLEFGGWKIWGGKCYLESSIFGVENLGWKMLSRISNLGGGKFRVENAISKFLIWGGGKFGAENAISNVENLGGKCYLESRIWVVENLGWKMLSRIWGVENLGRKMLSRISNLGGWKIWCGKCCLESRIWGVENLGFETV